MTVMEASHYSIMGKLFNNGVIVRKARIVAAFFHSDDLIFLYGYEAFVGSFVDAVENTAAFND